jgi:transcriptional regulator with XRE-family HTH domain
MNEVGSLRKCRRIQEALDARRMRYLDIARELGISNTIVIETAKGRRNNRRVLQRFLEIGAHPADLDLPEDLRAETNNATAVAQ